MLRDPLPAFTPGIDWSLPADIYHAIPACGSGDVKRLLRSPAHYRAGSQPASDALEVGHSLHLSVFEPARFAAEVVAAPKVDRRTTAGKAAYAAFEAEHAGKTVLSAADMDVVLQASAAVRSHRGAATLLDAGAPEVSLQWADAATGTPCKARIDWLRPDGVLLDLKSTRDASPDGFAREIVRYGYHLQAAHYLTGARTVLAEPVSAFVLIGVEKEPPYAVGVYVLDDDAVVRAAERVSVALARWAECTSAGAWPAYGDLIQPIQLPAWA